MKHLERSLDQSNQWWKVLIVIIVGLFIGQVIGSIPLLVIMSKYPGATLDDFSSMGLDANVGLMLMFLPFLVAFLFSIGLVKVFHRRSFSEVVNGTSKVRWSRIFQAFALWSILMLVYLLFEWFTNPGNLVFQFNSEKFLPLMVVVLVFVPFQSGYEEYLFRGYLLQTTSRWTNNRWIAIVITSIVFALMHGLNPEVAAFGFWNVMPQYLMTGLVFGIVSVLDDGIELAMGAHIANNSFLALFITNTDSVIQTHAVFEQLEMNMDRETLSLLVMSMVFMVILFKKYNWKLATLNTPVE